jgi:DNA polymerase-3 subunit delta'
VLFKEVIGLVDLKKHLIQTVKDGRVSHAQVFLGNEGSGNLALAIAYAQYINCTNKQEVDSCGECLSCIKYNKLVHPDLHFVFPVATTTSITSKPISDNFIVEFREAVLDNPYMDVFNWLACLGIENKQGNINTEESSSILKKLSLTTYESEYKVMVIWMAEKMNAACSNKLLKILEEPPEKTLFLLVVGEHEKLLTTIISRTQLVKVNKIKDEELISALQQKHSLPLSQAQVISHLSNGNYNLAVQLIQETDGDDFNFSNLQLWMRYCYGRKFADLITWVDSIASIGRERQKNFLSYVSHSMRETLLLHLKLDNLVRLNGQELEFGKKFSPFVHPKNCDEISEQLNKAINQIERNAHPKILLLDLSFKMVDLLHIPV